MDFWLGLFCTRFSLSVEASCACSLGFFVTFNVTLNVRSLKKRVFWERKTFRQDERAYWVVGKYIII